MKDRKLVYIVNVDWFFISHRLPLAIEALNRDYKVYVICKDTGAFNKLLDYGIIPININFKRSGYNLFYDFLILIKLYLILKKIKPHIVHSVTLKVSIFVALVHKIYPNFKSVYAISGLGFIFSSGSNFLNFVSKKIIYFSFNNKNEDFIFQNYDDLKSFKISNNRHIHLIKGSGIDLIKYHFVPLHSNKTTVFVMACRILKDKGVIEFCKAFRILKDKYKNEVEAVLVGPIDKDNPTTLTNTEINILVKENNVRWLGQRDDIFDIIAKSDVAVLPSYREGLPKFLIEASAIGRPIITTNTIGCKECVIHGSNGILVKPKDVITLFSAMEYLHLNPKIRIKMGECSRSYAISNYDIKNVIDSTFKIYNLN